MKSKKFNRKLSQNKTTIITFMLILMVFQNYFLNSTVRNSPKYEKGKNYKEWSAWGLDQMPNLRQCKLSDGTTVSCGPCAWMNLIDWYDLNFTPSLLPERTRKNNSDICERMNSLRSYLPTKIFSGKRFVYPSDMGNGYVKYILKILGYTSLDFSKEDCGKTMDTWGVCGNKTQIIKVVESALKKGYPVIVGLNRGGVSNFWGSWDEVDHHYCIAYKFLQCLEEPDEEDPNWILVRADYKNDVWINFEPVWGAWALGRLQSPLKDTYNDTSNFAPAAAYKNTSNSYRLAWTGKDKRLNVMEGKSKRERVGYTFKNKVTFGSKVIFEERSLFKPAIVFFKNKFFVSWTGTDNFLYIMNLPEPNINSEKKSVLESKSICAPALTVFKNKLYCAWIDSNKKINIASSVDVTNWSGKIVLNETSNSAPALASLASEMYLSWRGTDAKTRLNIKISSDGENFYGKQTFFPDDPNPTTESGPSLCAHKGSIYIAWQGKDNNQINFMRNINGSNWGEKITLWDTCISGVDISSDGKNLIIVWSGTDEEHKINVQVDEGT